MWGKERLVGRLWPMETAGAPQTVPTRHPAPQVAHGPQPSSREHGAGRRWQRGHRPLGSVGARAPLSGARGSGEPPVVQLREANTSVLPRGRVERGLCFTPDSAPSGTPFSGMSPRFLAIKGRGLMRTGCLRIGAAGGGADQPPHTCFSHFAEQLWLVRGLGAPPLSPHLSLSLPLLQR